MANLAGFMPQPGPGAIYGGDWSQPYSGIMDTLLQAQQAGQQRAWDQSPSGPSFNRRFGGMLPPSLNMPSAAPMQQQADPQTLAALQGALAGAVQDSAGSNFLADRAPGGGDLLQHSGSMQSQPWYDEYLAAHEAGAQMPMMQNMGGRGLNPMEQAGIQQRRQERLGGTLPMADRRANVRNNAIAESEQRSVRMGDMSENQQYFNELARLQGALGGQQGGGDSNLMNSVLFGPEAMVAMDRNNAERDTMQMKMNMLRDPAAIWASALANGIQMPLADIQSQMNDPQGYQESQVLAAAPDFDTYAGYIVSRGGSRDAAKQQWMATGKPDPDAPGFFGRLFGFGQEAIPRPAYTKPENAGGAYPIPYG